MENTELSGGSAKDGPWGSGEPSLGKNLKEMRELAIQILESF